MYFFSRPLHFCRLVVFCWFSYLSVRRDFLQPNFCRFQSAEDLGSQVFHSYFPNASTSIRTIQFWCCCSFILRNIVPFAGSAKLPTKQQNMNRQWTLYYWSGLTRGQNSAHARTANVAAHRSFGYRKMILPTMKTAYQIIHESLIDDDLSVLVFAPLVFSVRSGWWKAKTRFKTVMLQQKLLPQPMYKKCKNDKYNDILLKWNFFWGDMQFYGVRNSER